MRAREMNDKGKKKLVYIVSREKSELTEFPHASERPQAIAGRNCY
jgi:hypothetical protein